MSVPSLQKIVDTLLRPVRLDSLCTETGTLASSDVSGSSPRSWR